MECPECKSQKLVWDYKRGDVICSSCGLIVDTIYVNHNHLSKDNELTFKEKKYNGERKVLKMLAHDDIAKKFNLYMNFLNNKRVKLMFETKALTEYIYGKRAPVKILVKKGTNIDEEIKCKLKTIIDIINKYPRLASRTDRAKYALAYMVYSLINTGKVDIYEISKKFNLSVTHAKRLYNQLDFNIVNEVKYLMVKNIS